MGNLKKTILQVVICVGMLCMIWGGYFFFRAKVELKIGQEIEVREDNFSWVYQVDEVNSDGKNIVLSGFAFPLYRNSVEGEFEIVLRNIDSDEKYFGKMEYSDRMDVNEYFLCQYDYSKSGFKVTFKEKKIDLLKNDYEILLRLAGEKVAYQTGTYIAEGNLCYAKPTEFVPLEVKGTDLEDIVSRGVLRVYQPDYGIYVYQYDGELYWIADKDYDFDDNGNSYIEYQIDTTQIERLPEERLQNQWHWDNIGFEFLANEVVDCNFGKYRVAKKKIPVEYSITKIWTGNHVNGWIWRQDFRPHYQFGK